MLDITVRQLQHFFDHSVAWLVSNESFIEKQDDFINRVRFLMYKNLKRSSFLAKLSVKEVL